MEKKTTDEAFNAIHDEPAQLLKHELPEEVREGLNRIISIARYQFNDLSEDDKKQPSEH